MSPWWGDTSCVGTLLLWRWGVPISEVSMYSVCKKYQIIYKISMTYFMIVQVLESVPWTCWIYVCAPLLIQASPDGWAVWGVVMSTRWWLLVDHCVLRNWDRILVRAVKGINFSGWHGLDMSITVTKRRWTLTNQTSPNRIYPLLMHSCP